MSTPPLATYSERLLEVRRDFALYEDRVVVLARWFPNRRFEHVVNLASLQGEVQEVTIRYRMHRYAGWLLAISLLAYAVCSYHAQNEVLQTVGYGALAATIGAVMFLAATYPNRRIRFARFPSQDGRIGLDIGDAGNASDTFDGFVQQVRRQIRRAGRHERRP